MVNVNVSEKAWRFVRGYAEPGESFGQTLDRVLLDWKHRGDLIGSMDEEIATLRKPEEKLNQSPNQKVIK